MKKIQSSYFILFPTCHVVRGAKRNVLIDYAHDTIHFIPNDYLKLLSLLRTYSVEKVQSMMDDVESLSNFKSFLQFMEENGMSLICNDRQRFPELSESLNDENIALIDCIIELSDSFDEKMLDKIASEITSVKCQYIQIRQEHCEFDILERLLLRFKDNGVKYAELHLPYYNALCLDKIKRIVTEHAYLRQVFIYNSPTELHEEVVAQFEEYEPMPLGEIHCIKQAFDNGGCCGQICLENLDFSGRWVNSLLKVKNGCLYKKACIDKNGFIRNCPSMKETFGNIKDVFLKDVISNPNFTKFWIINKDQIQICKDCEFRYNCTDCRAFIENPNDLFSKPIKCSYNPYTGEW